MIGLIFAVLLASPAPQDLVTRCERAVHDDLASAATVCVVPETDLTGGGDGLAERCSAALAAGANAGKTGPRLPATMRAGLIRDFDAKLAACRAPPADPPKDLPVTQLWD
jgi:hypothetical protein